MDRTAGHLLSSQVRVLHVDDEPLICDVTRLCLERDGRFKVDIVNTAQEALDKLQEYSYACIISDYEMPSMNGLELLKAIRSFDPDIPFILFSGRGRETVVIDAINTGADFCIQKGGDTKSLFAELNHKVEYAIARHASRLALKRRDAILEAISLAATQFMSGSTFNEALYESITLLGLATEVDVVLMFRREEDLKEERAWVRSSSWSRSLGGDILSIQSIRKGLDFQYETDILAGRSVFGSSSGFAETTRGFLETHGICSLAAFPIVVNREIWGMIWFCDCISERVWAEAEVDALSAATAIIGSAIHQEEMRCELVAGKEQYESMYSLMRHLCDTVPDMLWAKDQNGKYIFVNQEAAKRLFGTMDTQEPIRQNMLSFSPNERIHSESGNTQSGQAVFGTDESVINARKPVRFDEMMLLDGKQVFLDIRKVPFIDQKGEMIGVVAVGRDVSEERESEKQLLLERKKYSTIFHQLHIGLISCEINGVIHDINKRAASLLGRSCEDFHGLNIYSLAGVHDTGIIRDFALVHATKMPVRGRGAYTDKKSVTRDLHYSIQPETNDQGKVSGILISIDEHYQE